MMSIGLITCDVIVAYINLGHIYSRRKINYVDMYVLIQSTEQWHLITDSLVQLSKGIRRVLTRNVHLHVNYAIMHANTLCVQTTRCLHTTY